MARRTWIASVFLKANGENLFMVAKFGRLNEEYARSAGNDGFMPQMSALVAGDEAARRTMETLRAHLEGQ